MRLLFTDGNLTEEEIKARDTMVYLFNPVLKFILFSSNPQEFKRYGYNSCRQTAILGAGYLEKLLPDYTFTVYEGNFVERINGNVEQYIHAFIIANKDDRHLLVDLSRTEKPLIFAEVFHPNIYPTDQEYNVVAFLNKQQVDYHELLETDDPEYITGIVPRKIMNIIDNLVEELSSKPRFNQFLFCDTMYGETTKLRR